MPRHIRMVLKLKDGNEYREGREDTGDRKDQDFGAQGSYKGSDIRPYNSQERRARY